MKAFLIKTAHVCDYTIEQSGRLLSWLTLGMVLGTVAVVLLRYGFNAGWIAMQESIMYMHALVFMLCAAYTLKHDGHVRIDIFYRNFSEKRKAWVDLLGNVLFLIPMSLFILFGSLEYVSRSWSLHESSPEAGGLEYVYLLKTVIPLMAGLLLLQAFAGSLRNAISIGLLKSEDINTGAPS